MEERQYRQADSCLKIAEALINPGAKDTNTYKFYNFKAWYCSKVGQYAEQFQYLQECVSIAHYLKNPILMAECQIGLAGYYEQFEDYKSSLPFILKALDYYKILKEETRIAYLYNKLGLIYYSDQEYQQAHSYFFASYVLYFKHHTVNVENAYWVQNTLSNMGLCMERQGNFRKALAYQLVALDYSKHSIFKAERAISVILSNIGGLYKELKKYDLAEKYIKEGLTGCLDPINEEISFGIRSLMNLGDLYRIQGRINEAESVFQRAYQLINTYKSTQNLGKFYLDYSKTLVANGKPKEAYYYLDRSLTFRDSTEKVLRKTVYSKFILSYELEKTRMSNDLLQNENAYRQLQIRIAIGTGIILLMLLTGILIAYRYAKARNNKLKELNDLILRQKANLQEVYDRLAVVDNNRAHLIQSVAHDLRTPIGNILSLNYLLEDLRKSGSSIEEGKEYLSLIQGSCNFALNICEDILDQSLIDQGRFALKKQLGPLRPILVDCLEILRFKSEPKGIRINSIFESDSIVDMDVFRLKRVLVNILVNAIKFSKRNSTIEVNQFEKDEKVIVRIQDHGIGISEHMIAQIFDRNTSARREGLEKEKTIGIGLSIARNIVEEHGGVIRVESKPNSGSTFYIELPLVGQTDT